MRGWKVSFWQLQDSNVFWISRGNYVAFIIHQENVVFETSLKNPLGGVIFEHSYIATKSEPMLKNHSSSVIIIFYFELCYFRTNKQSV